MLTYSRFAAVADAVSPADRDPLPLEQSLVKPDGCLCTIKEYDDGLYPGSWKWLYHPECPVLPEQHNAYNVVTSDLWELDVDFCGRNNACSIVRMRRREDGTYH